MEEWLSYRLGDFLMFSGRTYWRLFELENAALWPLPVVAPAAGGAALVVMLWRPATGMRLLATLLAVAWASVGWSFAWQRYAPINWGVAYLAPAFGVQALLLAYAAVRGVGWNPTLRGVRGVAGLGLLGWGILLHPFAAPPFGRPLAGAEIVGIAPDPTAIATLGLALLLPWRPLRLTASVVPALWLAISALTLRLLGAAEAAVPAIALATATGAMLGAAVLGRPSRGRDPDGPSG